MARIVGVVDLLAVDHPVAEVAGLGPRKVTTSLVNRGGMQQGLGGHALPVRATATEQVALDDGDLRPSAAGEVSRGFAGGAGTNDRDVVVVCHSGMIRARPGPSPKPGTRLVRARRPRYPPGTMRGRSTTIATALPRRSPRADDLLCRLEGEPSICTRRGAA